MRRCRKDAVHDELVQWHRHLGWDIAETYQLGQYVPGFPDALGVHPISHVTVLLEFKSPDGKLTKAEKWFHAFWRGPIEIERTVTDVMATHKKYMVSNAS